MNDNHALTLENISYSHAKGKALSNVNVEVKAGKNTVILGPNGAGKSILLKLCHGLLDPENGSIQFANKDAISSMVFPKPVFLRRTVLENLTFVLDQLNIPKDQQKTIASESLEKFNMSEFADYPARQLSSGEKQRLSLIRALLNNPDILFLDEPTANLDPKATAMLEDMIKNADMTTVMATHDLMQAKRIAEEIIFIDNGQIIETADAKNFFKNPKTEKARAFLEGLL